MRGAQTANDALKHTGRIGPVYIENMTEREIDLFARDMAQLIVTDWKSVKVKLWLRTAGTAVPDAKLR